jgi:hypothetical protein
VAAVAVAAVNLQTSEDLMLLRRFFVLGRAMPPEAAYAQPVRLSKDTPHFFVCSYAYPHHNQTTAKTAVCRVDGVPREKRKKIFLKFIHMHDNLRLAPK